MKITIAVKVMKIKSDEQLRNEIHRCSKNVRRFFAQSQALHSWALETVGDERIELLNQCVDSERQAIAEIRKSNRLQRILLDRQRKMIRRQKSRLYSPSPAATIGDSIFRK